MKTLKKASQILLIVLAIASVQACKSRKKLMKDTAPTTPVNTPPVTPQPQAAAAPAEQPAPAPAKPDYHFQNIQFEFNSSVLKTEAYPLLDKAASAMKADGSVNFGVNGYASSEGTAAYNMRLSIDRANSVKAYLINSGVNNSQLKIKGYGITHPIATNATEEGRILNRRVEIKKLN